MVKNMLLKPIALLILVMFCQPAFCQQGKNNCDPGDSLHWVSVSGGCLHLFTYFSDSITNEPNLVVVLHGDAPFNNPGYQYTMAKRIAQQNKNTISIGLLRPGYTDSEGFRSDGKRGQTTGDNYTPENIAVIAQSIQGFKELYHPGKTILIGHSGGAAITGDIIGVKPGLVNQAVLVSCPCYLSPWRAYMSKKQPAVTAWKDSVRSISPHSVINRIDQKVKVLIVSGEKDETAPRELSRDYYHQLLDRGLNARLIEIPNEGHEIFLDDRVLSAIHEFLSR
jgi:predicted esterase